MAETDEEQIEAIKKWWKENGTFVIIGLVIGAAAVFGWRAWENHKQEQAATASTLYGQMQDAIVVNDDAQVHSLGRTLVTEYGATPYAAQAALLLAKQNVEAGDLPAARENLQWVVENAADEALGLIARLRLAHVLHAMGENETALRTLGLADAGVFSALYTQTRGDIYAAMGQSDKARAAYTDALSRMEAQDSGDRAMLEMKLAALGATPVNSATPANSKTPTQ